MKSNKAVMFMQETFNFVAKHGLKSGLLLAGFAGLSENANAQSMASSNKDLNNIKAKIEATTAATAESIPVMPTGNNLVGERGNLARLNPNDNLFNFKVQGKEIGIDSAAVGQLAEELNSSVSDAKEYIISGGKHVLVVHMAGPDSLVNDKTGELLSTNQADIMLGLVKEPGQEGWNLANNLSVADVKVSNNNSVLLRSRFIKDKNASYRGQDGVTIVQTNSSGWRYYTPDNGKENLYEVLNGYRLNLDKITKAVDQKLDIDSNAWNPIPSVVGTSNSTTANIFTPLVPKH